MKSLIETLAQKELNDYFQIYLYQIDDDNNGAITTLLSTCCISVYE